MASGKKGRKRTSARGRPAGSAPAAGSSLTESSPSAGTPEQSSGAGVSGPEADQGQKAARRRAARGVEQLVILSVAIIFGLAGFAVHVLWIGAVVVMALLWGYIAAGLERSRRGGGVISDVATTVADEARDLTKQVTGGARGTGGDSATSATPDPGTAAGGPGPGEPGPGRAPDQPEAVKPQGKPPGEAEATKKELYEEAREAGIEGRSNMSKAELKQALDE
jgi:hypothetical protein